MGIWRHLGIAVAALTCAVPSVAAPPVPVAAESLDGAMVTITRFVTLSRDKQLQSPEAQAMLSGELANMPEATFGPLGTPNAVAVAEGGAVVRAPATPDWPWDVYFYLARSGDGWTIHAVRVLALPPFVRDLRDQLRAMPTRSAEEEATLRNIDLTLRSDADLRAWFGAHHGELDTLRGMDAAAAMAAAKRLDGTAFDLSPQGYPEFVIGGVTDNSVGFLFVPNGETPPAISPGNYIWIEPVGGGWYLFRTT